MAPSRRHRDSDGPASDGAACADWATHDHIRARPQRRASPNRDKDVQRATVVVVAGFAAVSMAKAALAPMLGMHVPYESYTRRILSVDMGHRSRVGSPPMATNHQEQCLRCGEQVPHLDGSGHNLPGKACQQCGGDVRECPKGNGGKLRVCMSGKHCANP